jgi:L-methionine (R)-S-oxide reductase
MTSATSYESLCKQLEAILADERDWLANLANTASLLANSLPKTNWVGFYLYRNGELILGPFMGKPACVRIAIGKGVCGTAAAERKTQVVADVHQFPGHIACDPDSQSEIVVPLIVDDELIGVLDIDSPIKDRFSTLDQQYIERLAELLIKATDWPISKDY